MATYNEKAWAFIRKTKQPFTAWDLARISQVSYNFAREYIRYLNNAGYIKKVGKKGKETLYRTVKITGINPVKINHHKRLVIDTNTGEEIPLKKQKRSEIQQQIWESILKLKTFTVSQIYKETFTNKDTIRDYLRYLRKAGYIEKIGRENREILYKLIKEQSSYPALDKNIQSIKIKKTKEKYQQIWNLIRILPQFTVKQLSERLREIHPETIRIYIKHLRRSGYLETIKKTQYEGFLYKLVRNSGEKAPILKFHKYLPVLVYDPNKNKTYLSVGD